MVRKAKKAKTLKYTFYFKKNFMRSTQHCHSDNVGKAGATNSGGGILLGSTSRRKSLKRACSDVQRRAGSRVSIRSSKSRAGVGKLC